MALGLGARARGFARRLGSPWSSLRALDGLGALSALVLFVCVNVLAQRFGPRWDVTSAGLYTLSPPTLSALSALDEPVTIVVLLGRSDPVYLHTERLLEEYQRNSPLLEVRYVDPDREPAEFMAVESQYRLSEARTEQGRLVSDVALIVARGAERWVIGSEQIVRFDEDEGSVRSRLEQALTEGLLQIERPTPVDVCFTSGHDELSIDSGGPAGLAALRAALERDNYRVRTLEPALGVGAPDASGCALVIVAGPRRPLSAAMAARLVEASRAGAQLLVAAGPIFDEDGRVADAGLAPVLARFGAQLGADLVIETDATRALPVGLGGEVFFATPKPHALTQGLLRGLEPRHVVLLELSRSIQSDGADATPLLVTSDAAFATQSGRAFTRAGVRLQDLGRDATGPFVVGLAAELEREGGGAPSRLVVLGSSSPLWSRTFDDPALFGTRRFVESALGWLAARPVLVELPDKPGRPVGVQLTEAALGEVLRYVTIYMPGTALLLGLLAHYRRRHKPPAVAKRRRAA